MKKPVHEPPLVRIDAEKSDRMWGGVEIFLRVNGRLPDKAGDKLTSQMLRDFIDRFKDHTVHSHWIPLARKLLAESTQGEVSNEIA